MKLAVTALTLGVLLLSGPRLEAAPAAAGGQLSQAEYDSLLDQKIRSLDAAIAANPGVAQNWDDRGYAKILRRTGNPEPDLAEAVKLDPGSANFRYHHAIALAGPNKHSQALAEMNEALRLAPNQVKYLAYRAVIYGVLGRASPSHADIEMARKLDPKDPGLLQAAAALNARTNVVGASNGNEVYQALTSGFDLLQIASKGLGP